MVSAVANGYENTVSLILFIDPVSLVVALKEESERTCVDKCHQCRLFFSEGSLIEGGIT